MIYLIGTIKQKNNGEFGLVDSNDIIGGYYQVDSLQERDSIPLIRRKEGMLCWVKNETNVKESKTYQLIGGIENSNWIEKTWSSGNNQGGQPIPEGYSLIWVGKEPPEDKTMLWWDTSDDGIISDESSSDMDTINGLITTINELENKLALLTKRVKYLEENGVVNPDKPDNPDVTTSSGLLLEDGTPLLLEDGTPLILEMNDSGDVVKGVMLLENGTPLLLENGTPLMLEDGIVKGDGK